MVPWPQQTTTYGTAHCHFVTRAGTLNQIKKWRLAVTEVTQATERPTEPQHFYWWDETCESQSTLWKSSDHLNKKYGV